jgi:hypothetical protein
VITVEITFLEDREAFSKFFLDSRPEGLLQIFCNIVSSASICISLPFSGLIFTLELFDVLDLKHVVGVKVAGEGILFSKRAIQLHLQLFIGLS